MISNKFFAHSIIYTIVGALPVATPILLLPLYTAVLSERQVGEIALYIASLYIMQIIVNFSLDASVKTFYLDYQHHIKHLKEYLSTVYFSSSGIRYSLFVYIQRNRSLVFSFSIRFDVLSFRIFDCTNEHI